MLFVLLRAYRHLQVMRDTLGAERVTQDADAVEETTAIAIANRSSQVRWTCHIRAMPGWFGMRCGLCPQGHSMGTR